MPNALKFFIGGDATPFAAAMRTVEVTAAKSAAVTTSALRQSATQLEAAMAAAQGAGQSTIFYAAALRQVNQQLAIMEVAQAKATASADKLAYARARVALGMANKSERGMVAKAELAETLRAANKTNQDPHFIAARGALRAEEGAALTAMMSKFEKDKVVWTQYYAEMRKLEGERVAQMLAGFETQRIAASALRAEEVAAVTNIARRGGMGIMSESGHKYGGKGGAISEMAVIGHELLQGRGTGRILGSVSILAQRLGFLGTIVKSTASEEITAAFVESDLAGAMARTAVTAEVKAVATRQSAIASGMSTAAAEQAAAADIVSANAARANALAQEQKAAATIQSAEIAAATAKVSLSPAGWGLIGGIVLIGTLVAIAHHFHTVAVRAKNLADMMNPLKKKFTEEADAMREVSKAAEEQVHWLKELNDQHKTEVEIIDEVIKRMREEADARRELAKLRGASASKLNEMDIQELRNEKQLLEFRKQRLELEAEDTKSVEGDAFRASQAFDPAALKGAERVKNNASAILDAVQEAFEAHPQVKDEDQNPFGEGLRMRPVKETDPFTAKVGTKEVTLSLEQAKKNFSEATRAYNELTRLQQELSDTLTDTKKTAQEKADDLKRIGEQIKEVDDRLGIKSGIGKQIAAMEGGRGGVEVTGRERVGLGSNSAINVSLLDVNRKMEAHQKVSRETLEKILGFVGGLSSGGSF